MKKISFIMFLFFCSAMYGQVLIDKPVILNGSSPSDRQIQNLSDSVTSAELISVEVIQQNKGRYGTASGTDSLSLIIAEGMQFYTPGNIVYFKASGSNTGPVSLSVNGLPSVPLKIFGNVSLKAGQLKPGQVYCAIYSGTEFQLLSSVSNDCRSGFIEVNKTYCIDINERPATYFYQAAITCNSNNARLCRWAEWYYACQKTGLGTNNMANNNWEWTDDASNADARVAGLNGCQSLNVSFVNTTTLRPYRCCYSK